VDVRDIAKMAKNGGIREKKHIVKNEINRGKCVFLERIMKIGFSD
jgi:hypothetical protein